MFYDELMCAFLFPSRRLLRLTPGRGLDAFTCVTTHPDSP